MIRASPFARLIEPACGSASRCSALPYGDQALFVRRDVFDPLGGYAELPIMEDVDLVRRARRCGRLFRSRLSGDDLCPPLGARRLDRRTARHLALIALYFCGVRPDRLVRLDPARRADPNPHGGRLSL